MGVSGRRTKAEELNAEVAERDAEAQRTLRPSRQNGRQPVSFHPMYTVDSSGRNLRPILAVTMESANGSWGV
jgi:hypothetical protein